MALDFLILYEHVVREYESILLLQAELRRRGYTAEIRQLLDRKKLKYFTWKKPRVLVASCLYDDEGLNSHVYNNVGVCNRVVNLHWEQMLSDTQEEEPWFNFKGNAKKCVQTCWGQETRHRLIAHGVPEQNAPVTGAVMMDFLRPEFAGYYEDKAALCARFGLDANKQLLLYISSFGYASMGPDEVRELSEMAGTDFSEFARVNRESMAQTLDWFAHFLPAHPEAELVYRRHPSEWDSPALLALERQHPNFHVIFDGSVKQWVTAADAVFIWMSTAIAEVYFAGRQALPSPVPPGDAPPQTAEPHARQSGHCTAGDTSATTPTKPCIVLRPMPIPHQFDPVIYKDCAAATTYAEFEATALAAMGSTANAAANGQPAGDAATDKSASANPASCAFPIKPALIEAYFDQQARPAYMRMADLLEEVHQNPPREIPFDSQFKPHFNWLKFFALIGVHVLFALRFNPARLQKIAPGFAGFAGRIYGYIEKAHVPKKQAAAWRAAIRAYVGKAPAD